MDISNTCELIAEVVRYCAPFSFIWAIVQRMYIFVMSCVTGGHRNL